MTLKLRDFITTAAEGASALMQTKRAFTSVQHVNHHISQRCCWQAAALDIYLRQKVREWAAVSGGRLLVARSGLLNAQKALAVGGSQPGAAVDCNRRRTGCAGSGGLQFMSWPEIEGDAALLARVK